MVRFCRGDRLLHPRDLGDDYPSTSPDRPSRARPNGPGANLDQCIWDTAIIHHAAFPRTKRAEGAYALTSAETDVALQKQ